MAKTDGRYEFDKVDYDTEVEATLNQISNNFQTIDDRLGKRGRATKTLPVGTTAQTFDRAGLLDVSMIGRTLVNLLGNADVTRFPQYQGSTIEDNTVSYDKPVYKFTIGSGTWGAPYKQIQTRVGASYLVAAEFKNITTANSRVRILDTKDTTVKITSSDIFETSYLTFTANADNHKVELIIGGSGAGESAHIAGVRVYEITATEKAYIDNLPTAEAQAYIAANYPYVDSMQSIRNPYVIASGRNLSKTHISDWELGNISNLTGGDIDSAQRIRQKGFIPVNPTEDYTLSFSSGYGVYVLQYDNNKKFLDMSVNPTMTWLTSPHTFTPNPRASYIRIIMRKDGDPSLTLEDYNGLNLMLNVGDTTLPFEEYNETYKFFHGAQDEEDFVLRSNVDGSVVDALNGDTITRRLKEIALDGTFGWTFYADYTGFKVVSFSPSSLGAKGGITFPWSAVKYDGTILKGDTMASPTSGDLFYIDTAGTRLYVSISNTDSGWGDDYTPTADEIKAYFNGWKMYQAGNYNTPYESGQKAWTYRLDNGGWASGTTSLPTDMAPINAYWKPYRLQYELAQPVTVKAFSEGDVIAHEGVNQITVGAGVVVRESNVPALDGGFYRINDTKYGSPLKYRLDDFYKIYQDGYDDNNWKTDETVNAFGRYKATRRDFAHNPEASYSVTYFVLDKHLFGIPAPVDVTTSGTELDTIESLVEYVALLKREIDVLKRGE